MDHEPRQDRREGPDLRYESILGIPVPSRRSTVKDGWLARVEGEVEVAAQVDQLVRDRAEDPVIVKAGLADREHPWVGRELHYPRPAGVVDPGGVVGMDADGCVEPGQAADQIQGAL